MSIAKKAAERTSYEVRKRWDAENMRRTSFSFVIKSDADILAKLDSVPNKTDYVRQLIRADLAKEKTE